MMYLVIVDIINASAYLGWGTAEVDNLHVEINF
jgi:hypothetical protein